MPLDSRVIVVGMNPGGFSPLRKNSTHERLGRWMDQIGVGAWSFVNVQQEPGVVKPSLVDLSFLARACHGYRTVLALGKVPSRVLDSIGVEHHSLPHPSGRNRLLNDKEHEARAILAARRYVEVKRG